MKSSLAKMDKRQFCFCKKAKFNLEKAKFLIVMIKKYRYSVIAT